MSCDERAPHIRCCEKCHDRGDEVCCRVRYEIEYALKGEGK